MFTELHALAQKATLMMVVTADGDQLRISVTPTPTDSKATPLLRPLSLIGTAAELDAGFSEALTVWQAPKRSLVEQAAAAAGGDDDDNDDGDTAKSATAAKPPKQKKTAAKPAAKVDSKPTTTKAGPGGKVPGEKWPFPTSGVAPAGTSADVTSESVAESGNSAPELEVLEPAEPAPPAQPEPATAAPELAPLSVDPELGADDDAPPKDDFSLPLF